MMKAQLEYRFLWIIIYGLTALYLGSIIANFLIGGSRFTYLVLSTGLGANLVFAIQLKRQVAVRYIPLLLSLLLFILLILAWFRLGGNYGSVPFIYLTCIIIITVILSVKQVAYVVSFYLCVAILLSYMQIIGGFDTLPLLNPTAVSAIPYSFIIASVIMSYVSFQMKRGLEGERNSLQLQKAELEEKNKLICEQNEEIVQLNTHLEERVARRTEELEKLLIEKEVLLQRLKHEDDFLNNTINSLPMGIMAFEPSGHLYRWNEAVKNILEADEIEKGFNILADPFIQHYQLDHIYQEALLGKATYNQEFLLDFSIQENQIIKKRNYSCMQVSVFPVYDEHQEICNVLAIFEDITEHKITQESLKESDARLRSILESSDDSIAFFDAEQKLLTWNKAYQHSIMEFRGIKVSKGVHLSQLLPPKEENGLWDSLFERSYQGEKVYEYVTIEHGGHQKKYYEFSLNPVYEHDKFIGVAEFARDVTERKKEEVERALNEHRIKTLLDNLPVLLWSVNASGHIEMIEGSFMRTVKAESEQFLGKPIQALFPEHKGFDSQIKEGLKNGRKSHATLEKYGAFYDVSLVPLKNEEEKVYGMIGMSLDVTDRILYQETLRRQESYLRAITDNTQYAIWALDKKKRLTCINQVMHDFYLREFKQSLKMGDSALYRLRDPHLSIWNNLYDKALQGEQFSFEYSLGSQYYEISVSPIYIENKVEGVAVFGQNISHRKRSLEKLKERGRFIDNVLMTIPGSVFVYYPNKNKTEYLNNSLLNILGYEKNEAALMQQAGNILPFCFEEDTPIILEFYRNIVSNPPESRPAEIVLRMRAKSGAVKWLLMRVVVLSYNADKSVKEILCVATDITSIQEKEERLREKNEEILRTKHQMAEYKLMALRSIMNPHFLFNALNSIQYFIAKNKREDALSYLSLFSRLIRRVITSSISGFSPLQEELDMLKTYIKLEQMRFEDKLKYHIDVEKGVVEENYNIPSLLIQPFVENAIIHGINNKKGGGHLSIKVQKKKNMLLWTIEDDGVGREKAMQIRKNNLNDHRSVGVMVGKERLEMINKECPVSLEVEDLYDHAQQPLGTRVKIYIEIMNI